MPDTVMVVMNMFKSSLDLAVGIFRAKDSKESFFSPLSLPASVCVVCVCVPLTTCDTLA